MTINDEVYNFGELGKWSKQTLIAQREMCYQTGYTVPLIEVTKNRLIRKYEDNICDLETETKIRISLWARLCGRISLEDINRARIQIDRSNIKISLLKGKIETINEQYSRMRGILNNKQ